MFHAIFPRKLFPLSLLWFLFPVFILHLPILVSLLPSFSVITIFSQLSPFQCIAISLVISWLTIHTNKASFIDLLYVQHDTLDTILLSSIFPVFFRLLHLKVTSICSCCTIKIHKQWDLNLS